MTMPAQAFSSAANMYRSRAQAGNLQATRAHTSTVDAPCVMSRRGAQPRRRQPPLPINATEAADFTRNLSTRYPIHHRIYRLRTCMRYEQRQSGNGTTTQQSMARHRHGSVWPWSSRARSSKREQAQSQGAADHRRLHRRA
jgi:hypothetical protein